jgi:lipopolysaccharide export system permease protein
MPAGFPITLWRSIIASLWTRLLLTAGVLVTVIAFAAAIKPLADGKLDAGDALRFILLAIPPMLAYALPFAGGFCSTLVFHRFAADNELTAAKAGGLSYRTIFVPALVTGLTLSAALVVLNEQVIPRFLRGMQEMVTTDAARLLAGEISKGRAVEFSNMSIYADRAERLTPDPSTGAKDQLVLLRVAVVRTDATGKIVDDVTARRAAVWLFPGQRFAGGDSGGETLLYMLLQGADGRGSTLQGGADEIALTKSVPGAFSDDPKFLTSGELIALRKHPEGMNWIDARRRGLAARLATGESIEQISRALVRDGKVELLQAADERITIYASGIAREGARSVFVPSSPGGRITIEQRRAESTGEATSTNSSGSSGGAGGAAPRTGETLKRWSAQKAWMEFDDTSQSPAPQTTLTLRLQNVRIGGGDAPIAGERAQHELFGLSLEQGPLTDLLALPSESLIERAAGKTQAASVAAPDADATAKAANELSGDIASLRREITSKQHERMALAVSCCVMVITGAVMAFRLSGKLPLIVYLWSFFPALASMITISAGQRLTHQHGSIGLLLLWGGVAALAIFTLIKFRQVARL